jgi:hypothetical protein
MPSAVPETTLLNAWMAHNVTASVKAQTVIKRTAKLTGIPLPQGAPPVAGSAAASGSGMPVSLAVREIEMETGRAISEAAKAHVFTASEDAELLVPGEIVVTLADSVRVDLWSALKVLAEKAGVEFMVSKDEGTYMQSLTISCTHVAHGTTRATHASVYIRFKFDHLTDTNPH